VVKAVVKAEEALWELSIVALAFASINCRPIVALSVTRHRIPFLQVITYTVEIGWKRGKASQVHACGPQKLMLEPKTSLKKITIVSRMRCICSFL
jgi:hypothetical protein